MDDMKIGGMHGELGLDVRGWFDGFEDAREALSDFAKEVMAQFKQLEGTIRNVGLGLSAAITAPFAGMALVSKRGAGEFEKSMNNVHAALRGISPERLVDLSTAARQMGPAVGRSATEAADGIETLALAGMSADDVLNGGLRQTLLLASANAADLGQSAAVLTDVMAQFGKTSGDLEGVVNNITGALDASKLGFNDFKDAIAQGGGVAGSAGVSFEDFNTALAGTSALFGSGADAGTSFKTFITTLTPKSKEAAAMMEQLGLKFYDADGKMKGLAETSEMLREKLGNLSDRSRTKVLTEIFGADAMRTAIGLMRLGGQAFTDLQKSIAETDAGDKLAIQLQGVEQASKDLSNAFDNLKIALGETGILAAFTAVTKAITSVVQGLAELPLWLRQIVVAAWAVAAAAGPMVLGLLGIAKVVVPIVAARGALGAIGIVLSALINPLGTLIVMLGRFALSLTGVSVAARAAVMAMAPWAYAIGLVVTALVLLYMRSNQVVRANDAATKAAAAAADSYRKQQEATLQLVAATGAARVALIEKIKLERKNELQLMATAAQAVKTAQEELRLAKVRLDLAKARQKVAGNDPRLALGIDVSGAERAVKEAEATLLSESKTLHTRARTVESQTRSINTPELGTVDLDFDKADAGKTSKGSGPSAQELSNRREQMKLEQQMAVARARDDKDEVRRIQDKLDILQRQRDYEDAGLKTDAARTAAAKDIAQIKAAEAEFNAREIAQAENALDQQLAEIRGDEQMARYAADKAYLEERTTFWQGKGLTILQAQKRAAEDLVQVDIARADAAAKVATQQALEREAELSRIRGDSAAKQRAATREAEAARRAEQYYRDGEGKVTEEDARDRANRELDEEERARQQGQWRDTFKGAFRAALDGDLGGFVKNWWKDQVSRGLEEALNSLTDMLFNMFRQAMGQAGGASSGGGGWLSSALSGIGSIFAGAGGPMTGVSTSSQSYLNGLSASLAVPKNLPGFATGGSFEIGGAPGIDTNLVQFWGTAGETVNISRGDNDNGGGGNIYHITGNVLTPEMWAQIQAMDGAATAQAVGTTERRAARRSRRRMGR